MRLPLVCIPLVIALPGSAAGQAASDTARPSPSSSWYIAGGVELGRFTRFSESYARLAGPSAGPSFQAGYTRQFSRLGVRVGLAYFERERDYGPAAFGSSTELYSVSTSRTVAANLDLTYDVTRSRSRFYAIGGLMPYRVTVFDRDASGSTSTFTHMAVALSPGAGLRVPVRGVALFVEARQYFFSGHSHVFSPLTVGVRF